MSEMVERVARALCDRVQSEAGCLLWPALDNAWDDLARAAIRAMHEPTESMIAAGIAAMWVCTDADGPDGPIRAACIPEHAWAAMVGDALR